MNETIARNARTKIEQISLAEKVLYNLPFMVIGLFIMIVLAKDLIF